jgi:4-hydroxyproline epimerase
MSPIPPAQTRVIDSHTGGEPTRCVISGGPDLGGGTLFERRQRFREAHDAWRTALVCEPRGSDVVVGALLCAPLDPSSACGVIFFNNVGYLGMCGHGTIGVIATLAHLGRIKPGDHRIETPVGTVVATLHADGSTSVANVPSYRHATHVAVDVAGHGIVHGDVAWGGNWFFLCHDHGQALAPDATARLTEFAQRVRDALQRQGVTGREGAVIDHIELVGPPADTANQARNFVLCPGGAYDRSPCGTGTSAKLACLAADGTLAPGALWRQESVIGSVFSGTYARPERPLAGLPADAVLPIIQGRAHVTLDATLVFDPADPFAWGLG